MTPFTSPNAPNLLKNNCLTGVSLFLAARFIPDGVSCLFTTLCTFVNTNYCLLCTLHNVMEPRAMVPCRQGATRPKKHFFYDK